MGLTLALIYTLLEFIVINNLRIVKMKLLGLYPMVVGYRLLSNRVGCLADRFGCLSNLSCYCVDALGSFSIMEVAC